MMQLFLYQKCQGNVQLLKQTNKEQKKIKHAPLTEEVLAIFLYAFFLAFLSLYLSLLD